MAKHYLNPNSQQLKNHIDGYKNNSRSGTVYNEIERPKGKTRVWLSYDIQDDTAPAHCRTNLESWLHNMKAESFGESVATFLISDKCYTERQRSKLAEWLIKELHRASVLQDVFDNDAQYYNTPGISIYVIYRSRTNDNDDQCRRYSNHFVLIQNANIKHLGGY